MLIFAKDLKVKDPHHSWEDRDPDLKAYMDYQRKLFPYTIVRAGLDLAYKELDDILKYIDHEYQPPPDSNRKEFPADIPAWVRQRFPWASVFLKMEDLHSALVVLIRGMDSFRTEERINAYHLAVLYDAIHNIVQVYNRLLETNPNSARDIRLSNDVPVHFDDFINNYFPHLDFMILSKPDYPHTRHMARNREIEEAIKSHMADGDAPLTALEKTAGPFGVDGATLALLRRDDLQPEILELDSKTQDASTYEHLSRPMPDDSPYAGLSVLEAEYSKNFDLTCQAGAPLGR